MIPPRSPRSSLSASEWRAAFRPRPCLMCGTRIIPAQRTTNPSTARRILTCSKACESRHTRARRSPAQIAADARSAAIRFARWQERHRPS